jgi:phage-related tail fiber protein
MQDIMTANSSSAQQSVIQTNSNTMNVDQQQNSANALCFTATIYTQDVSQNNNQQVIPMQQSRTNNSSQSLMTDLNPFLNSGMNLGQQITSTEIMAPLVDSEKQSYKEKPSRGHWKGLP